MLFAKLTLNGKDAIMEEVKDAERVKLRSLNTKVVTAHSKGLTFIFFASSTPILFRWHPSHSN